MIIYAKNEKLTTYNGILRACDLSRRDNILLTVDFNLRIRRCSATPKSRRDDTIIAQKCRPCGTGKGVAASIFRRINSTVNKVSSLRDCHYFCENI